MTRAPSKGRTTTEGTVNGERSEGDVSAIAQAIIDRIAARGVSPAQDALARREQAERQRANLREFYVRRCDERGVPRGADVRRWIFPDHVDGEAFDVVARALTARGDARDGRWALVLLLGATGRGKSSALARAVARHRHDAHYILAPDAAQAFDTRVRSFDHDRATQALLATLRDVDLLAIDEVGTEGDALCGAIENLVATRCTNGLVTLLAGNLSPEAFAARYRDPRLESRLDAEGAVCVVLSGADLRRSR